jgi:DNA-binding NtrC family response regulator
LPQSARDPACVAKSNQIKIPSRKRELQTTLLGSHIMKILVIEEGQELRSAIENAGCDNISVQWMRSASAALDQNMSADFELIVWDTGGISESTAEIARSLRKFAKHAEQTPIILVADVSAPEDIVDWGGRNLWLARPYNEGQLKLVIESAVETAASLNGEKSPPPVEILPIEFDGMIAVSMAMRMVFQQIMQAAEVNVPVLVTGETGTGKDLVAAAIHRRSNRKNAPYLPVNKGSAYGLPKLDTGSASGSPVVGAENRRLLAQHSRRDRAAHRRLDAWAHFALCMRALD